MTVIDLFAGPGGWDLAARDLGVDPLGIEWDGAACATRKAAGLRTRRADVAALDPRDFNPVEGLIGSPPCQAYSTAGKGLGRVDKPHVIACAHELAAGHDSRAERAALCRDPRSLLTVEPLRWTLALRPRWVALEQVPAVLELWSEFAGLLAVHGYHVATGVLHAEQFGVPQTRRRAFLLASLDGPVELPAPTHRRFVRGGTISLLDAALLPWKSIGEALGWTPGPAPAPAPTVTAGGTGSGGGVEVFASRSARDRVRRAVALRGHQRVGGAVPPRYAVRSTAEPALTVDSRYDLNRWIYERSGDLTRPTIAETSILQTFPPDYPWHGSRAAQYQQVGNAVPPILAEAVLRKVASGVCALGRAA